MQLPVTTMEKDHAFFLSLSDITFIRLGEGDYKRDLLMGTRTDTFRLVRPIQEMAMALEGTKFMRVNQDIIVNMERAEKYDPKEFTLIFKEASGAERMESCHVSRDNRTRVRNSFMSY